MNENSTPSVDKLPSAVGLLGSGLIGGGWAARYLLNGVDVKVYDPSPGFAQRVGQVLERARRATHKLTQAPLPREGRLRVADSVEQAVRDVELVHESAPERLELKQHLLAQACRASAPETLICSSTSMLRPSLLQDQMPRPERFLVAHPFQPVYLVPLIELCAGAKTGRVVTAKAAGIFRAIGMHPLVVRNEVHGFLANRIQSAAWREALWLVHDGVATVQEVDDAVRFSFGLRRPVLGPFMTFYVGSGEAAPRTFAEKWAGDGNEASSKLETTPKRTNAFLDLLAAQIEELSLTENISLADYSQTLDEGLIAVLQGLRSQNLAAGKTLARWEQSLHHRASSVTAPSSTKNELQ